MADGAARRQRLIPTRLLVAISAAVALVAATWLWWWFSVLKPTSAAPPQPPPPLAETGTPVPLPSVPITPDNADRVVQLARLGEGRYLRAVSLSPDGRWVVAGTLAGAAVWDARTLETVRAYETPLQAITDAVASDGATVATVSLGNNDRIRLRRADPHAPELSLEGHEAHVTSLAFSSDGALLASGALRGPPRLWRVADGAYLRTLEADERATSGDVVAFSSDGALVLTRQGRGTIHLWRAVDGSLVESFPGLNAALAPDRATLATVDSDGGVRLHRLAEGGRAGAVEPGFVVVRGPSWNPDGAVAFSPDGTTLAAAWVDGTIRVWRIEDGALLQTFQGSANGQSLAFAPDGATLVHATAHHAQLWRRSNGALLGERGDPSDGTRAVSFEPDGQTIEATHQWGGPGGVTERWRVADARLIEETRVSEAEQPLVEVAWNAGPLGAFLGVVQGAARAALWRPSAGDAPSPLDGGSPPAAARWILGVLSLDARTLTSLTGRQLEIRDVTDGALVRTIDLQGRAAEFAMAPDGETFAAGYRDGGAERNDVKLWRTSDGALLHALADPNLGEVVSLAFSPDGTILAAGFRDGTVRLWRVADGWPLRTLFGHSEGVSRVLFSPDGARLAAASWDGNVRLWRVADGVLLQTPSEAGVLADGRRPNQTTAMAFAPAGVTLALGWNDGTIQLVAVADGALQRTIEPALGRSVRPNLLYAPDGSELIAVTDELVWRLGAQDGLALAFRVRPDVVERGVPSPDGTVRVSTSGDSIIVRRTSDGTVVHVVGERGARVGEVAFSPDGTTLATGHADGAARLWRVADGALLHTLRTAEYIAWVDAPTFSPDGRILATVPRDGTVRLWRVADGEPVGTLAPEASTRAQRQTLGDTVRGIAFSPDGRVLAAGSFDHRVRLFDVEASALLKTLEGHRWLVTDVAFSPDGRLVASVACGEAVRLWGVP